jgi:hypothetical protein
LRTVARAQTPPRFTHISITPGPLSQFWEAARELDPEVEDESQLVGTRDGDLARLLSAVGLNEIETPALSVSVGYPSFEDWWEPFTLGVGPAGAYTAGLDARPRAELRELCRERMSAAPFVVSARAWAVRGLV